MASTVGDENAAPNQGDTDVVMTNVENRYTKQSKVDSSEKNNAAATESSEVFSPELLGMYYSRLFPYQFLYDWLSYEQKATLFSKREFSFTIEPAPGEEIYIRYQSFSTQEELTNAIMKRRPNKIDIGAIFSHPPKDHNAVQAKFHTEQRELVFDIDLTDYDDVRCCGCSGAKICNKCWTYMTMAIEIMESGLREDFGFKHIAWFYSGRRGVHCWVSDSAARQLSNEARSALASYFEVSLGTDKNKKITLPHPLHPMLARAYTKLEPMFLQHVVPETGHKLLSTEEHWTKLLETLPDAAKPVQEKMMAAWKDEDSTPEEKWATLKKHLNIFIGKNKGGNSKTAKTVSASDKIQIESWPAQTVFKHTYPRLDVNVSKMQNHLLKSPFCVHPKTGRVCVPMDVSKIETFDPFAVPTLDQLQREIDSNTTSDQNVKHDWQKTSLKEPFEHFQKNFLEPLRQELRKEQRDLAEQRAAQTGDF